MVDRASDFRGGEAGQVNTTPPSIRRKVGYEGESQVCRNLQKKGFCNLATNFHSRFGEIDLIMANSEILLFIEVKTAVLGRDADELFTGRQLNKILKTSNYWLCNNPQYSEHETYVIGAVVSELEIRYIKLV